MIVRDVRMKFDNMKFGALWSCARPLIMMTIMVTIKKYGQDDWSETLPFALYLYSGIVYWFFLCDCMAESMASVQKDAGIMSKVFYPRLISPLVPLVSNLVELSFALLPLVAIVYYHDIVPGGHLLLAPMVLVVGMLGALAMGLIFAALSLQRKDWNQVFSLILYVGLFASPIFMSFKVLPPEIYRWALLNPAVGLLGAFRSCLDGRALFPWHDFGVSVLVIIGLMLVGIFMFYRTQKDILEKL